MLNQISIWFNHEALAGSQSTSSFRQCHLHVNSLRGLDMNDSAKDLHGPGNQTRLHQEGPLISRLHLIQRQFERGQGELESWSILKVGGDCLSALPDTVSHGKQEQAPSPQIPSNSIYDL